MEEQVANLLVLQTGGTRPSTNAVLAGIILSVGQYSEQIQEIYGVRNGPLGLVTEEFVNLLDEKRPIVQQIQTLNVPALGSSLWGSSGDIFRQLEGQLSSIFSVLEAHRVKYMIIIGGVEAAKLALIFHKQAKERGYELYVNSVPVTISNDLSATEHTLGYATYIRQSMLLLKMIERDVALRPKGEIPCCIIETSGWDTGWEVLGAACAVRYATDVRIMALIPEVPIHVDDAVERLSKIIQSEGPVILLVPDGMRNPDGSRWAKPGFGWDYFGQAIGPGAGVVIAEKLQHQISGFVTRLRLPVLIRWWMAPYSAVDLDEAFRAGQTVLEACLNEQSGLMAKIRRTSIRPYRSDIQLHFLDEVLQKKNPVPVEWYDHLDWKPNDAFWRYVEPIVQGEVISSYLKGMPKQVGLEFSHVPKRFHLQATGTIG